MRILLLRIRPQILTAILALTAIALTLIYYGHLEGAVGVAGFIAVIAERVLQSQDAPTILTTVAPEDAEEAKDANKGIVHETTSKKLEDRQE